MSQSINIRVVCRVRPLNKIELDKGEEEALEYPNKNQINTVKNPKTFTFDDVYEPDSTQADVYETAAKPIVKDVLDGFNGTIFAYGQTSSGKTYTMEGVLNDKEDMGIIPRINRDIFNYIDELNEQTEIQIKIAYFEIYNEKIKDLMDKNKQNLPVHEDKNRIPYVKGLTEEYATSPEEVMGLINKGKKNRKTAGTNMNEHSSRSHAVFQIQVIQENKENNKKTSGKLYLVDLAGSEKVSKSGAQGERLDEAKNINKSLSCLGNVISALTDKTRGHIPYRDSKLTRILQESLGGNSRTTVIICVSPAGYNQEETRSTLLFGQRAKTIKNVVSANVEFSAAEWKRKHDAVNKRLNQVKDLTLKLIAEAWRWRKGEQVPPNEQIDLDELKKLLESEIEEGKGGKGGSKGGGSKADIDDDGDEGTRAGSGSTQSRIDKERLKKRLSKTSIARSRSSKKSSKKKKTGELATLDESAEDDQSAMSEDVPEDVLAVLKAEVDMKTQELEEEKAKLGQLADDKDDEIAELTQKVQKLEETVKQQEKAYKDVVQEARKIHKTGQEKDGVLEKHKERNRRLEEAMREMTQETDQAKKQIDEKENEVRNLNKQMQSMTQEAQQVQEQISEVEDRMRVQSTKYGEQLAQLAQEIASLGKTIVPEEKKGEFEVEKVDTKRTNETFSLLRVLLAKARHYQQIEAKNLNHMREELRTMKNEKNAKEQAHVEQMVLLNQSKEKMEKMQDELEDLREKNAHMEEKVNKRNDQIAAIGRGERLTGTDQSVDPDLEMMRDEQRKQERVLKREVEDAKEKRKAMEREKDEWQLMAESLKAEIERLKADIQKQKEDMKRMEDEEGEQQATLVQMDLMQESSNQEIQTLNNIKRQMAAAFARANQAIINERKADAKTSAGASERQSSTVPNALPYEGELFQTGNIAQRQIEFLETNLDWVNKNNRNLAKEANDLKREVIPKLREDIKKLQSEKTKLQRLLKDEKENAYNERMTLREQYGTGMGEGSQQKRSRNPSVTLVKGLRSGSRSASKQKEASTEKTSTNRSKSKRRTNL